MLSNDASFFLFSSNIVERSPVKCGELFSGKVFFVVKNAIRFSNAANCGYIMRDLSIIKNLVQFWFVQQSYGFSIDDEKLFTLHIAQNTHQQRTYNTKQF